MNKAIITLGLLVVGALVFPTSSQAFYPQELIQNGGFEATPPQNHWSQIRSLTDQHLDGQTTTGLIGPWPNTVWHSGANGARLGHSIYTQFVVQRFTIDPTITAGTLRFWYTASTSETSQGEDALLFYVQNVENEDQRTCDTRLDAATLGNQPGWTLVTCDVTAARGQTVDVAIGVQNDFFDLSTFSIDDISLVVEYPDVTAPVASLAMPPAPASGFYTTPPSIVLSAADDFGGSGLASIHYAWDGGSSVQYAGAFGAPVGKHILTYWATDASGNSSLPQSLPVWVDTAAPIVTAVVPVADGSNGWHRSAPLISFTSSDDVSGVAAIRFHWDGGVEQTAPQPVALAPAGTHLLTYWAVDVAGYTSAPKSLTVRVDVSDPVLTITNASASATSVTYVLTGRVIDPESSIQRLTINGQTVTVATNGSFSYKTTLKAVQTALALVVTNQAGRTTHLTRVVTLAPKVLSAFAAAPRITKVRKTGFTATSRPVLQKFTVAGQNFKKGTKVKIGKVTASQVVVKNGGTLVFFVRLSLVPKGIHNLTIINPDGQRATLRRAIRAS